jgi:hypothetical protein
MWGFWRLQSVTTSPSRNPPSGIRQARSIRSRVSRATARRSGRPSAFAAWTSPKMARPACRDRPCYRGALPIDRRRKFNHRSACAPSPVGCRRRRSSPARMVRPSRGPQRSKRRRAAEPAPAFGAAAMRYGLNELTGGRIKSRCAPQGKERLHEPRAPFVRPGFERGLAQVRVPCFALMTSASFLTS